MADVLFKAWGSKDLFLLIEIIYDNFSLYKLYIVYTSRQFLLGIKQAEWGLFVGWILLESEKSFLSTTSK